jgi:hypothetical protein
MGVPLNSIHGDHLFALLPEIYRERDTSAETAHKDHLRGYLNAHGVLLDRLRGTLEQLYADHFPDVPEEGRVCQAWVIPYLADLVGAVIVSPFANGQREEVANAVRWNKAKGTLRAAAEIAEAVTQTEAELQEGYACLARFAVAGEPILPAAAYGEPQHPIDALAANPDQTTPWLSVNPQTAALHPGQPAATMDFRMGSRAVRAPRGSDGSRESRFGHYPGTWPPQDNAPAAPETVPVPWRQANPHGPPCFPGSYEDVSARTADMRTPDAAARNGRFHPQRLLFYLPPPAGFFPLDPLPMTLTPPPVWDAAGISPDGRLQRLVAADNSVSIVNKTGKSIWITGGAAQVSANPLPPAAIPLPAIWPPDNLSPDGKLRRTILPDNGIEIENITAESVHIAGAVSISDGRRHRFVKLIFDDKIAIGWGALELDRCAVKTLEYVEQAGKTADDRSLDARSCLFDTIAGAGGMAKLEYCTVLSSWGAAAKPLASDCIFPAGFKAASAICLRYSSVDDDALPGQKRHKTNTSSRPIFLSAKFGETGAGVLAQNCSAALLEGAEDGGEMGVFHDWRFAAQTRALKLKLSDFLPMGMQPVTIWDARLRCVPPHLKP